MQYLVSNRYLRFSSIVAIFLLLSLYYFDVHKAFMIVTSDVASIALMANDILSGNYLLKGWGLPSDSYYTVGALFAVFFMYFIGLKSAVVFYVAAVTSALAVLFTLMLIAQKGIANFTSYLIAAVLLLVPPTEMLVSFATPGCHVATFAYLLIALWLVGDLQWDVKKNSLIKTNSYLLLYFSLLILADLGDPFGYVLTAAMFAVFNYRLIFFKEKLAGIFAFVTVLAIASIFFLLKIIPYFGGFTSHPLSSAFTFNLNAILQNIKLLIESALSLFGLFYLKFLGNEHVSKAYYVLMVLRTPFFLLTLYALFYAIKHWFTCKDIIVQIACMTFFADIGAFIFNTYTGDLTSSRFLIPMVFMGAILIGRQFVIRQKALQTVLFIFALGCAFTFIYRVFYYPTNERPPIQDLIASLNKNHLSIGYGNYWTASVVTLETKNRIIIRPLVYNASAHNVIPSGWNSKKQWYKEDMQNKSPNFFIVNPGDPVYSALTPKEKIIKIFGRPSKVVNVDHYYEILVWNKNINP